MIDDRTLLELEELLREMREGDSLASVSLADRMLENAGELLPTARKALAWSEARYVMINKNGTFARSELVEEYRKRLEAVEAAGRPHGTIDGEVICYCTHCLEWDATVELLARTVPR